MKSQLLLPSQSDLVYCLPGLGAPTIPACLLSLKHTQFLLAFALLLMWISVFLGLSVANDSHLPKCHLPPNNNPAPPLFFITLHTILSTYASVIIRFLYLLVQ